MVLARNKAKHLLPVNHSIKAIYHHQLLTENPVASNLQQVKPLWMISSDGRFLHRQWATSDHQMETFQ